MRSILVWAIVGATALTTTPSAFAQPEPTLTISPATVNWGSYLNATAGPCETFSQVTSPGLAAPITLVEGTGEMNQWRGHGNAARREGAYTATVQCDGRTLSASFTVLPPKPPKWALYPLKVEPGGEIFVVMLDSDCPGGPDGPVTSPGFAASIEFTAGNMGSSWGRGDASTVPGAYTATLRCRLTPLVGEITFRILGAPPAGSKPAIVKPNSTPPTQTRPAIVKPSGAPQTGGGDTTGS